MPTLYEYAVFCMEAGRSDEELDPFLLQSGWELFLSSKRETDLGHSTQQLGYFGISFINHARKEIVIAHRGTKLAGMPFNLVSDSQIALKIKPFEAELAKSFSDDVLHKAQNLHSDYVVFQTGHSLGGFHAHFCAYLIKIPVVSFDNPGCSAYLSSLHDRLDDTQLSMHLSFLSLPNLVNIPNTHVGVVYRLKDDTSVNLAKTSRQTIATHAMKYIIDKIPQYSGDPFESLTNVPDTFQLALDDDSPTLQNNSAFNAQIRVANFRARGNSVHIDRISPPGSGAVYYQAKSALRSECMITQEEWLVSHIAVGSIFSGHSMLVVEGIKVSDPHTTFASVNPFVGYYHLRVLSDDNQQEPYGSVFCEEYDYHRYKKLYRPLTTASWKILPTDADKMITHIKTEEANKQISYDIVGRSSILRRGDDVHNCTSWALAMLKHGGIQSPENTFNKFVEKPVKNARSSNCLVM